MTEQAEMVGGGGLDPVSKLPVMLTVTRAYRFVFGQPINLITALALPFLLWIVLQWGAPLIAEALHAVRSPTDGESGEPLGKGEFAAGKAAYAVFMAIAQTLLAVAWHRLPGCTACLLATRCQLPGTGRAHSYSGSPALSEGELAEGSSAAGVGEVGGGSKQCSDRVRSAVLGAPEFHVPTEYSQLQNELQFAVL